MNGSSKKNLENEHNAKLSRKIFCQNEKRLYLCSDSFHHASHLNSEPGWNFCFKNMRYNKQPISITDQIAQLKIRGLIIDDEIEAEKVLSTISYFRFANYLRPMEADHVTHNFKPGKDLGMRYPYIISTRHCGA